MPDIHVVGFAGDHISDTAEYAIGIAKSLGGRVVLCHNDHQIVIHQASTIDGVLTAFNELCDAARKVYEESPAGVAAAAERTREQAEREAREAAGPVHDRDTMVKAKNPWPKTAKELEETIAGYVNGKHTYDTAAIAMSLAATAAFNYVATVLGTTGFQAGWAIGDFERRNK